MAHLHRVVSTATQRRLPGLPHPGTTKINAPNPLGTSLARRELSFEVRSAWHHLVPCDVLFSPPKICFFTQLHGSTHHGHRVSHHPQSTTRRSRGSGWRGDGKVWRWEMSCITNFTQRRNLTHFARIDIFRCRCYTYHRNSAANNGHISIISHKERMDTRKHPLNEWKVSMFDKSNTFYASK